MTLGIDQTCLSNFPKVAKMAGQQIVLGTRPESFFMADGSAGEASRIRTKVDLVEMLGAEALVYLQSDAQPISSASIPDRPVAEGVFKRSQKYTIVARLAPQVLPRVGELVDLHYELGALHFFDPKSGKACIKKRMIVKGKSYEYCCSGPSVSGYNQRKRPQVHDFRRELDESWP